MKFDLAHFLVRCIGENLLLLRIGHVFGKDGFWLPRFLNRISTLIKPGLGGIRQHQILLVDRLCLKCQSFRVEKLGITRLQADSRIEFFPRPLEVVHVQIDVCSVVKDVRVLTVDGHSPIKVMQSLLVLMHVEVG